MDIHGSIMELSPEEIKGESLLYVGFNMIKPMTGMRTKRWWYDLFSKNGFTKFTILEVYSENVNFAKQYFAEREIEIDIVEGNVLDASDIFKENQFDVSVFWHGPEHLPVPEIDIALMEMEKVTKNVVIIGCPHGMEAQGQVYGNPHEVHISGVKGDFYKERGFLTQVIQRRGLIAHLTAIKILNNNKER